MTGNLCYTVAVRHRLFIIFPAIFLCACGHKNVQVSAPQAVTFPIAEFEGIASYYAEPYHGRRTANGEVFDTYRGLTAAHRTLPFNTMIRVTNKLNGRAVDLRINDRGPFVDERVIDLSLRAAQAIDMIRSGVAPVKVTVLSAGNTGEKSAAFAVQVAALDNLGAAQELKRRLDKKYSGVMIESVSLQRTQYRVRIKQPDLQSANKLVEQLRMDNLAAVVVRLN